MSRPRVGIDLAPIAFRSRAPGTAVHVENQARALMAMKTDWDWVLVATPRTLTYAPEFSQWDPVITADAPLSYHVSFKVGNIWSKAGCAIGLATAFFCPWSGPPVITNYFDSNALHPVRDYLSLAGFLKWHAIELLHKFARHRSRALFVDSEYARAKMIEAEPASAPKWVVAPCGCPAVGPAPRVKPSWADKVGSKRFILYVGACSPNKNQLRLIQAWDQLRRRTESFPMLVLIGPCPGDYLHKVIGPACATIRHPEEIIMTGFVSDDEVAWAFRTAHAYVQPSFAEGFGMPMIQAMSCGLPVACSNSTSLPEIAGRAALFFDPADINNMASIIEVLVFNDQRRMELRTAGLERAQAFTWHRHAEIVNERIRRELESVLR